LVHQKLTPKFPTENTRLDRGDGGGAMSSGRRRCDQVPTAPISAATIMRRTNFRHGLEDARSGRPPRFDELDDDCWSYERGRLFGFIAPLTMPLTVDGKLNRKALALFEVASRRGLIP
jgi:hypothetical protein